MLNSKWLNSLILENDFKFLLEVKQFDSTVEINVSSVCIVQAFKWLRSCEPFSQ